MGWTFGSIQLRASGPAAPNLPTLALAPMQPHLLLKPVACALAALAVFAAEAAPGAEWRQHIDTPDSRIFVRKGEAISGGPRQTVWLMTNHLEPVKYAPFTAPARSSTMVLHFDCPARRWAVGDTVYFRQPDAAGEVVWSDRKQPAQLAWEPLGRDALGAEFSDLACTRQAP
jgi:hypothetical protein